MENHKTVFTTIMSTDCGEQEWINFNFTSHTPSCAANWIIIFDGVILVHSFDEYINIFDGNWYNVCFYIL